MLAYGTFSVGRTCPAASCFHDPLCGGIDVGFTHHALLQSRGQRQVFVAAIEIHPACSAMPEASSRCGEVVVLQDVADSVAIGDHIARNPHSLRRISSSSLGWRCGSPFESRISCHRSERLYLRECTLRKAGRYVSRRSRSSIWALNGGAPARVRCERRNVWASPPLLNNEDRHPASLRT